MRILHLMISCFYVEGYSYQENLLPKIHKDNGNNVEIIASTESFKNNLVHTFVQPGSFINEHGIKVTRLPYLFTFLPKQVNRKIRVYKNLFKTISAFNPEIIMFHGLAAGDLYRVSKYCFKNRIKLYVDSHEDHHNSGTNFLSNFFLHRLYYRIIIKLSLPYIVKVLSISHETTNFIVRNYKIPLKNVFDFPLGGELISEEIKSSNRLEIIAKHNLNPSSILFLHSGKFDSKKKTFSLIDTFVKFNDSRFILLLAGQFDDISSEYFKRKYNKNNIILLGWLNSDNLTKYLSGSDMYLQPGSQSATMQKSLCCFTPTAVFPHPSYVHLLSNYMPYIKNEAELYNLFFSISNNQLNFNQLIQNAVKIASEKLDYKELAKIIEI